MIKKGLKVRILTGRDRKKEGEVIEIDRPNNRAKVKEIMDKFNIRRAYIYKIMNENDIDYKSEIQTNIDITEINEIIDSEEDDIFDELNNDETIDKNTIDIIVAAATIDLSCCE